ncbi:MAG: outer membrane protein assembly factor BamD [Planctomycetota bacterium]|nr:outer membrane protein assembly factor BamD [Planctomycetota bacterium]
MSRYRIADVSVHAIRFGRTVFVLALSLAVFAGCQATPDLSAFRLPGRGSAADEALADTSDVKGPIQRVLEGRDKKKKHNFDMAHAKVGLDKAQATFKEAQELKTAGKAEEARKRFEATEHILTHLHVKPGWNFDVLGVVKSRFVLYNKEHPYREDALFLVAEAQFEQDKRPHAQDHYEALLSDYASTRHMDQITKRLFSIGQEYLGFPEFATTDEIKQVNFENPRSGQDNPKSPKYRDPTLKVPILPNFHDKTRPTFDTQGHAMRALKSIWLHDPTGPLADDAVMLEATYHLRNQNWAEAARKFKLLREQFPQSPHLETAFVLGSHVELMSYQGPSYDGTSLSSARQLKESTLRLYPETRDRGRLRAELKKIDAAEAERAWHRVRVYQRKGRPRAVAVMCMQVIEKFPMSEQAQKAREVLAGIDPSVTATLPGFGNNQAASRATPGLKPVPVNTARPVSPPKSNVVDKPDSEPPGRVRL